MGCVLQDKTPSLCKLLGSLGPPLMSTLRWMSPDQSAASLHKRPRMLLTFKWLLAAISPSLLGPPFSLPASHSITSTAATSKTTDPNKKEKKPTLKASEQGVLLSESRVWGCLGKKCVCARVYVCIVCVYTHEIQRMCVTTGVP